jgi:hypothetical protein
VRRSETSSVTWNANMFSDTARALKGRAASLAILGERIILGWRDAEFPGWQKYVHDGTYFHPDLRLEIALTAPPQFWKYIGSWGDASGFGDVYTDWDHLDSLAMRLKPKLGQFFRRHRRLFPGISYIDFTTNAIVAANLARKRNAFLLGNSVFHEFYQLLYAYAPKEWELFPEDAGQAELRVLDLEDVSVLGLDFAPANLEALLEIRANSDVNKWTPKWREAFAMAEPTQVREAVRAAMREAYETKSIRKFIRGGFEMLGSAATWAGVIPVLGNLATAAGIVADVGTRAMRALEKPAEWCLLGARMHKIALEKELR